VNFLDQEGKSVPGKRAIAAALKQETTTTNRWLGENLRFGNLYELNRKVGAWLRDPDRERVKKLQLTTNHKNRFERH
jgi:hypothetical protein